MMLTMKAVRSAFINPPWFAMRAMHIRM